MATQKRRSLFCIFIIICCVSQICSGATTTIRSSVLHFLDQQSPQYFPDAVLTIENGKIQNLSNYTEFKRQHPAAKIDYSYQNSLIMPGFVDTHIHYPQTEMVAMYGEQLLEWLNKYTFPTEKKFSDQKHADRVAKIFFAELLRNGTTTANIFNTSYDTGVNAVFAEAERRDMRIITGKVIADQMVPEYLRETPEQAYLASKSLIHTWHNKPGTRLLYAVTPRFPPSTSPAMFKTVQRLITENPTVYLHSHAAENKAEIALTKKINHVKQYTDSFAEYGLLKRKSIMAHSIYLTDDEFNRFQRTETSIAFCPTSNLFLGSGLFKLGVANKKHIAVGLGTDIGAGTSFSILQTLNEAYKVAQLQNIQLDPYQGLYLATLGGATALRLDDKIGNFLPGKEADFVVLDLSAGSATLKTQMARSHTLPEKLFNLMILGDDRSISQTFINGKLAYDRKTKEIS